MAAAQKNNEKNNLTSIITVSDEDLTAIQPAFDLVVANITHDTLANMASSLVNLLAREDYLILAGILQGSQEKSMVDIYTGLGLTHHITEQKEEWVAIKFHKP